MRGVVSAADLNDAAGPLDGLLAALDPDYITAREAPGLWEALESIRRRVAGAQVMLARLVDESSAAKDAGLRNGAEWIAKASGASPRAGYAQVAASYRLTKLPTASAALRRGDISVAQAEAIADAATCDPSAEEPLLERASTASLGELRTECLRVKAAADPDPDGTHERIQRERRLRQFLDPEGAWCLSGRGTTDAASEFATVLGAITDEIFRDARDSGNRESADAYRFDALIEMARRAWQQMHRDDEPTPTTGEPQAPRTRRRKAGVNPRHLGLVRIDYDALVRGQVNGDEVCEVAGLGPIPVSVARSLLGDAVLKLVITKGVGVANVTSLGRGPTAAQRVALLWSGKQCSRLGCHRPATEFDHRKPFAEEHVTHLHNLDGLCSVCHALKTYEGWALVPGVGKRPMVPPDDPRHPGNPTFHRRRPPKTA